MKAKLTKSGNIKLTLSIYQAGVLLAITDNIGGKPQGPRGVMDEIGESLDALDVVTANIKCTVRANETLPPSLNVEFSDADATK